MAYLLKYRTINEWLSSDSTGKTFPSTIAIGSGSDVDSVKYTDVERLPYGMRQRMIRKVQTNEIAPRIFWYIPKQS